MERDKAIFKKSQWRPLALIGRLWKKSWTKPPSLLLLNRPSRTLHYYLCCKIASFLFQDFSPQVRLKPRSGCYGGRLLMIRSWVQIPSADTRWWLIFYFRCKIELMFEKNEREVVDSQIKRTKSLCFSQADLYGTIGFEERRDTVGRSSRGGWRRPDVQLFLLQPRPALGRFGRQGWISSFSNVKWLWSQNATTARFH